MEKSTIQIQFGTRKFGTAPTTAHIGHTTRLLTKVNSQTRDKRAPACVPLCRVFRSKVVSYRCGQDNARAEAL